MPTPTTDTPTTDTSPPDTSPPAGGAAPVETAADVAARMVGAVPASYAAAEEELAGVAAQLEGGQVPIDQLVDAVTRATELLDWCRATLQTTRSQIAATTGRA